jgi:hypothetical protein
MERSITMTPDEYLSQIRQLVASSKHAEALAFADAHARSVEPPLSVAQDVSVGDVLHIAAMAMGMDEYAATRSTGETVEIV